MNYAYIIVINKILLSLGMEKFREYRSRARARANWSDNADGLNAVIRSLSSRIRSVILVRVLRRHDRARLYLI